MSSALTNLSQMDFSIITAQHGVINDLEVDTIEPINDHITIRGDVFVDDGALVGNTTGIHIGQSIGDLTGNVKGNLEGNVKGNVEGNVTGTSSYATTSGTAINFAGEMLGDVIGPMIATVIKPNAVTTIKIADGAVSSSKLAPGTIIATNLADGSVTTPKLADSAVTNIKIQNNTITDAKLTPLTTAGKVLNSATTATNANTANAIVSRDGSGNFSAGTITASLNGNASTATHANDADIFNVSLYGDVLGPYNNTQIAANSIVNADINASAAIADTKLATISSSGKVSNSATTATSANTANAIISRDANRNYFANTANLRNANLGTGGYGSLTMGGGNSIGAIYPAFSTLGDGLHFGYNYAATEGGTPVVLATGGATSRISVGYGSISLCTGPNGVAPTECLRIDNARNISTQNGAKFVGDITGNLDSNGENRMGWLKTLVGAGGGHLLLCNPSGSQRWGIGMGGAESGGNVGGNFIIWRYGNDGGFLNSAIEIERSTGALTVRGETTITGGLSLNNGQNITNVGTIFPTVVHFPASNGTITGSGKITFTNDGVVDFYHRNLTLVKSLSIDGSVWGSDPASTSNALTLRSSNNSNHIGMNLGRLNEELDIGVCGAAGNYMSGTIPGDSIIRTNGSSLFLSTSNTNPSIKISNNNISILANNATPVMTVTPSTTTLGSINTVINSTSTFNSTTTFNSNIMGTDANFSGVVNDTMMIRNIQTINSPNTATDYIISNTIRKGGYARITIFATNGTSIQSAHLGLCWGHGNETGTQVGGSIAHKSNNITMGGTTFSGNFFWAQLFTITNITGNFQLRIQYDSPYLAIRIPAITSVVLRSVIEN